MKGFQTGISVALLAAVANAQGMGNFGKEIGKDVSAPIKEEFKGDIVGFSHHPADESHSGGKPSGDRPSAGKPSGGEHHGSEASPSPSASTPAMKPREVDEGNNIAIPLDFFGGHSEGDDGARPRPQLAHDPASHPPMGHVSRAVHLPEEESVDEGNSLGSSVSDDKDEDKPIGHGPTAIPTCSTHTEKVVQTITKTVTSKPSHSHHPVHSANIPFSLDALAASSSTSTPSLPQETPVHSNLVVVPAPEVSSPAPSTHRPVHAVATPMTGTSSTPLLHKPMTTPSSAVHGVAATYNVVPVHVPSSSQSSIKLHGTPSAAPSGADPHGIHGTYFATPSPSVGMTFMGAGPRVVPSTGLAASFVGLVLAYAL